MEPSDPRLAGLDDAIAERALLERQLKAETLEALHPGRVYADVPVARRAPLCESGQDLLAIVTSGVGCFQGHFVVPDADGRWPREWRVARRTAHIHTYGADALPVGVGDAFYIDRYQLEWWATDNEGLARAWALAIGSVHFVPEQAPLWRLPFYRRIP